MSETLRCDATGLIFVCDAQIREILETQEGAEDVTYRETVFEGTGIYCPTA